MRLTIELEPDQLFTTFLQRHEVEEIVKVIVKQYRDEALLWKIVQNILETIMSDYQDEHEWYVERQVKAAFEDQEYSVDADTIKETESYILATEKISNMVKLLREGRLEDVK